MWIELFSVVAAIAIGLAVGAVALAIPAKAESPSGSCFSGSVSV